MIRPHLPVALIILAFILFASVLALASDGVYHDDDLQHFEMARWAWHDPRYLLNLWGRPGCTIPYAIAANIGTDQTAFMVCRFLTILFASATAILTALCARRIGIRNPELAVACLLFAPLYFHLSYTTLTEIVCGLYLIGGTYLLLVNRFIPAALVLGLAPLARQESVALLALIGLMLLYRRQWLACGLLGWGLVAWQLLAMAFIYDTPLGSYLRPKPTDIYGSGGPLHFVLMWGEAIGPSFVGLCLAGAAVMVGEWLEKKGSDTISKEKVPDPFILIIPLGALGLVALHTIIFMRGLFAGGGYARFLLPACPWMALCIAVALERLWAIDRDNESRFATLVNRSIPVLMLLGIGGVNLGLRLNAIQADGSFAWRWPHWQLMIAWKIGLVMILPAVVLALWRHRLALYIVAVLIIVDATGNLVLQAQPHRLAQTQRLLEAGVDVAVERMGSRQSPRPGPANPRIIAGFSPWIPYFRSVKDPSYAPPSMQDPSAESLWRTGPSGMIFLYDSSLTPSKIDLSELTQTGKVLYSLDLNNPKHAPDPYVVVLEKK